MSNPVKRITRRGERILVIDFQYIDETGRKQRYRRDAFVQTAAGARAEAQRLMDRAARTGSPLERNAMPTFTSFVDTYYRPLFMPRLRPGTRERYEGILRQGVIDRFGSLRMDQILKPVVLAYAAELKTRKRGRKLRGRTHGVDPRGHVNLIKAVTRAAVELSVLAHVPELPSFREGAKLPSAPSPDHITAVLDKAEGWLLVAAALQIYGGLRQGEVRALQVGDIDLGAGVLHVKRAYSEDEIVEPKGDRQRAVPLLSELADILRLAVKDKLQRALVITGAGGRPMTRQAYLAKLKAFEKKHGLEQWWSHALRHYFCTALARAGVSIEAVRVLAGHGNVRTTQRYLHASGGDLQDAIGKLRGNQPVTGK